MHRQFRGGITFAFLLGCGVISGQVPGRNINMVSGTTWPGGDPFLQRQNEPSIAASTRNPLHLLAGANDYRSVDLPNVTLPKLEETEEHGDAWLGLFESFDGGQTWQSNLLPGCQYKGCGSTPFSGKYEAASDPVVRAGTNGMFYYSGIAFQRDQKSAGVVFVARYIDNNNKENGDPIDYVATSVVASGTANTFLDKPWIAVDIPREGALTCNVNGQLFPGGNLYIAYASFTVPDEDHAAILFSRSRDCGATWSTPLQIAANTAGNQGPTFAIDPINGTVYLAWRQFATSAGAVWVAKSTNGGASFSAPVKVANITAFDQATSETAFRTNAYPTLATDANGRVYIAWSDRVGPSGAEGCGASACARIVVSSSADGQTWSSPQLADPTPAAGHQWMPALTYSGGLLSLVYYDSRDDHQAGVLVCKAKPMCISISDYVEELISPPQTDPATHVFTPNIDDNLIDKVQLLRRHTIDVRVTQSPAGSALKFSYPSTQVTQYLFGSSTKTSGAQPIDQLRYDPPNLPMFDNGTEAFLGDYIDVTPLPAFVPVVTGTRSVWRYNVNPTTGSVVQTAWTDNRDVIPPPRQDWQNYTPPQLQADSIISPGKQTPACAADYTGTRNQNIYTARVAAGVVAGSPGNTKPLSTSLERGFVVFVENTAAVPPTKTYRLTIPADQQPAGGYASFVSKSIQASLVTSLDVVVPALSSISRTVFVTASDAHAQVNINVTQITGLNGNPVAAGPGTSATIQLNPDLTNPDLTNPDLTNPDLTNPDITNTEVYNPDLTNLGQTNPDLTNPDLTNPDLTNPDLTNHEITNPDLTNPGIPNPDLTNPDLTNPDLTNQSITTPDLTNGSISDTFFTITNNGNTAAAYSVKLLLKGQIPDGIQLQLLLYRVYTVPAADGCTLYAQPQNQLIANIPNPVFTTTPDLTNPDLTNGAATNATLSLAPGETARIDLRTASPSKKIVFDPRKAVTVVATAQAVNTNAPAQVKTIPAVASSGVTILPVPLPDGVSGGGYTASAQIARFQGGAVTWAKTGGTLPPGLSVAATGVISGNLGAAGTYNFTLSATSVANPAASDTGHLTIRVGAPLQILTTSPLPAGTVGAPYSDTLSASGGLGAYTWAITFGSLPAGLTLNASTGVISGTPTTTGVSVFRVSVTDSSSPSQTTRKYPLSIKIN